MYIYLIVGRAIRYWGKVIILTITFKGCNAVHMNFDLFKPQIGLIFPNIYLVMIFTKSSSNLLEKL